MDAPNPVGTDDSIRPGATVAVGRHPCAGDRAFGLCRLRLQLA